MSYLAVSGSDATLVVVEITGNRLKDRYRATAREVLAELAGELFLNEGYDSVTLERVAREGGVSIRTVMRYFQSKDQLALARHIDARDEFRAKIENPERTADTITFWREHVRTYALLLEENSEFWRRHLELIEMVPALTASFLNTTRSYEDLLTESLARESGLTAPDLRCRFVAAALISANLAAMRHWIAEPDARLQEISGAAIEFVLSATAPKTGPADASAHLAH